MKISRLLLSVAILSICALGAQAQQFRYAAKELTIKRQGDILTATDAAGKQLVHVDLTKPALKGKVIAFAYSSKKKEIGDEVIEPVNSLILFPNPASKQVQLDLKGKWEYPVDIQIFDKNGNSVQSKRFEAADRFLDIAPLHQGIYILKAESGNAKAVEKLVVQ
ncbi:Por secretion system C-terminal sorting domain-containing protein [Dyadobacter sp. SG02]|uniref:T9SS type A sorting domain-containing protein n=1 Tax=Dyadobacter sp. SG02 TaxID=1855291 RepID=UPI0008D66959|nr:T9SS type A sorting domain-containing protein [Dyadobacter sp. SG02]SEJ84363.1 Por secretion system C-terminal sorting domain-containing protein [Dyadobacter sp. SG02]